MPRAALFLVAMLLAILALVGPRPAEAQLRTFCSSPTMDYCASFLDYYVAITKGAWTNPIHGQWSTTVELFGAGYEAATIGGTIMMEDPVIACGAGWTTFIGPRPTVSGPGTYTLRDTSGGGGCPRFESEDISPTEPSVYHVDPRELQAMVFNVGSEGTGWAGCSPRAGTCHEVSVPEPSSLLLLASGMLGLGYTGCSRRRHHRTPPARKS